MFAVISGDKDFVDGLGALFNAFGGIVCCGDLNVAGGIGPTVPNCLHDGDIPGFDESVGVEEGLLPVFFAEFGVKVASVTDPKSHGLNVFVIRRLFEPAGGQNGFFQSGGCGKRLGDGFPAGDAGFPYFVDGGDKRGGCFLFFFNGVLEMKNAGTVLKGKKNVFGELASSDGVALFGFPAQCGFEPLSDGG